MLHEVLAVTAKATRDRGGLARTQGKKGLEATGTTGLTGLRGPTVEAAEASEATPSPWTI